MSSLAQKDSWFETPESCLSTLAVEEEPSQLAPATATPAQVPVRSKWELVDYGDDSDDKEDDNE